MRDLEILCECPFCGKVNSVMVAADDYAAYLEGMLIQDALPYLSADEREMIKTGICGGCWDNMFADDDESEDE